MAKDDVIIIGSLQKKELEDSISELVAFVEGKTNKMAQDFTQGLDKMKLAMKDFAITQKVSVDLMKEAWRSMSSSFDAMVAAQSASGGGNGIVSKPQPNTIGELKEQIRLQQQKVDEQIRGTVAAQQEVNVHRELQRQLKEETKSELAKREARAKRDLKYAITLPMNDLQQAQDRLRELIKVSANWQGKGILDWSQWNRLNNAIDKTKIKIEQLTSKQPKSLKDVLGMDESSVDAISKKMAALKHVSIDPKNTAQVRQLGEEYQRLSRLQATLLGKNIQLTHSNNYLAQSFGYIRNRVVYALTLGAITNFVKQIYDIRGQYELLERSLGILIDNMRRGSEIFNELNTMAMKSPFTLIELASGAKQLMAYNFAEDEVVDTTRRLADISAALGVPMERLVYNLGQIRAQTVLNARDARDFANAGLAIVPMLAKMYTEQKKFGNEIVTTSQVYDMMSKKLVSYADVMKVLNSITNEGGKFYNFQEKQAETMRVQINNLTLAYNNMLNEIGKEHQQLLTAPLRGLRLLFDNWQTLVKVINAATIAMGMYYTRATLVSLINGTLITQGSIRAGYALAKAFYTVKDSLIALRTVMLTNPLGVLATITATAIGYMALFNDNVSESSEYATRFGESGGKVIRDVESLYTALESLDSGTSTYKKVLGELNQILGDYNLEQIKETDGIDAVIKSREKNIQLIKEEIIERKHLNDLEQGKTQYDDAVGNARKRLQNNLSNAITENFFGIGTINKEIAKNAPALATIISDIIESNIDLVANKTGDEYEKGIDKIFGKIQERLRNNKALGLSEDVINSSWLENNFFRFYKSNIITNVINDLKEAKEANDAYNQSINENYEAEKQAAEAGATFNDRVKQSSDALMTAANDTDKFYGKINQLIKDYSGQNIIDFLVRVNAQVPKWMMGKSLTELTRLAARFGALAQNAKGAVNVNGKIFSKEELATRAALYAEAAKQKQANDESRKSTTITNEASQALKEYKSAIEAVKIAKNRLKQGTADQALVTEKETEAQKKYNEALKKGVSAEELKKARDGKGGKKGSKKDILGDALTKEIQLIKDIQNSYKEYKKEGVDAFTATKMASEKYNKSLAAQNATLSKFGIKGLTSEELATMDLRQVKDYYKEILNTATKLKNAKGIEALEKAISGLNDEILKIDYKKITDGLNNELGKLKDDYELAIELDANPELGNMFADMFNIDTKELPHSFGEAYDKANKIAKEKLKELKVDTEGFDLMSTIINGDDDNKWRGVDITSQPIQDLIKHQKTWQEMFKKNMLDTEKTLDDYVKKYGDYSDKIAEIESDRLERLHKLNEAYYTNEMRKRPEYIAKLNSIEQGAQKEKGKARFDEFKNSRLYVAMFENLEYASTATLNTIRRKLEELKGDLNSLSPEQLRQVTQQFEKIDNELIRRNPFKGLIKNVKDYAKAIGKRGKQAQKDFVDTQKKYDYQERVVTQLKEELEQRKHIDPLNKAGVEKLLEQLGIEEEKLKKLKEELNLADQINSKYDAIRMIFKEQTNEIVSLFQTIASNLQSLGELRDTLSEMFGVDLGNELNAIIDDLSKVGEGVSKVISSAQSGDFVGTITGVVQTIVGIGDSIASVFGDGAARTKRINREINASKESVRQLNMAYKDLERVIEKSLGSAETSARRAAIANKEAELSELERQMALEESKRSKDRDEDAIKQYQETMQDLRSEIQDLKEEVVTNLLGSDVKSAAEEFVDTWVDAWRAGETTLDAIEEKMDEITRNIIKKAVTSKIVANLLQPLYDAVDNYTMDNSIGGVDLTTGELQALAALSSELGVKINDALGAFYGSLESLGVITKNIDNGESNLSALQAGIQGITEDTAGALEAYMNGVSQQVYLQSDILTQIRDVVTNFDFDVQLGVLSQMLLQLQNSYQTQQAIHQILENVLTPSGRAFNVELLN